MRVRDLTSAHRRLLADISSRISVRLETSFRNGADVDGPNLGIMLVERGRNVVIEVPFAVVQNAEHDVTAREALRVRLKGRRDRMLFTAPPAPLPKNIAPVAVYGAGRDGGRPAGRWRR